MRKLYALLIVVFATVSAKAMIVFPVLAIRGCPPCPFCK
jgi:hypothetical protein